MLGLPTGAVVMRGARLMAAALAVVSLAAACRTAAAVLPANRKAASVADRFAREFWSSSNDDALDRMLSYRLKTMMRVSQLRGMRDGMINDQGPVQSVGAAWYEDSIIDYKRFRVPVDFGRTIVDMRIVIDESGLVSQFFFVDHIQPPL